MMRLVGILNDLNAVNFYTSLKALRRFFYLVRSQNSILITNTKLITNLNVIATMKSIAIIVYNDEDFWVDDMGYSSFAATADNWWTWVTSIGSSSIASLHAVWFHVREIWKVIVWILRGGSFEHHVVNSFSSFFREARGQWSDH